MPTICGLETCQFPSFHWVTTSSKGCTAQVVKRSEVSQMSISKPECLYVFGFSGENNNLHTLDPEQKYYSKPSRKRRVHNVRIKSHLLNETSSAALSKFSTSSCDIISTCNYYTPSRPRKCKLNVTKGLVWASASSKHWIPLERAWRRSAKDSWRSRLWPTAPIFWRRYHRKNRASSKYANGRTDDSIILRVPTPRFGVKSKSL